MTNGNLEDALSDGGLISFLTNNSLDTIVLLHSKSMSEEEKKIALILLNSNWKKIKKYEIKYPNSEYIKESKETILKTAKTFLPEKSYNKIYG
jgi:hypothetical protein